MSRVRSEKCRIYGSAAETAKRIRQSEFASRRLVVARREFFDRKYIDLNRLNVGPVVSAIGKKAGVVVDERLVKGATAREFASAHDLRRAFGQRWSRKLARPQDLQEFVRHASLTTTFAFYVTDDVEATADAIWEGSVLGSAPIHVDKQRTTAKRKTLSI
jgi:integrase